MMRSLLAFVFCFGIHLITAQDYHSSSIFAHNDYVHPVPFYVSYSQQVGFIEADVFLYQSQLAVAHTKEEINPNQLLAELYLKPLANYITENQGYPYADHSQSLTLMIDLKTEGVSTLNALVKELNQYPVVLSAQQFYITVSGDVPDPSVWKNYPTYIHFDGRPHINYTDEQLKRVHLISTSFQLYSRWNGKGVIPQAERDKLHAVIQQVHAKGKPIRFWATPDFTNAWITLMKMKVDIIGTDDVLALSAFVQKLPASRFQSDQYHEVDQPKKDHSLSRKNPKNIILLIGDGMGLTQLYAGYTANKGRLSIFTIPTIGFSITTSADSYITDSAAGATAMSTGSKTNNRYIGMDTSARPLATIPEKIRDKGYATALISAGDITDATPAAFYAHQPERSFSEAIANDFMASNVDILIGGGIKSFTQRADKRNLFQELTKKGYTVSGSFSSIDTVRSSKFVILDDAAVVSKMKGRGDFLSRSLNKSLNTFTRARKPFFIMAEGAQIDYGGHDNSIAYVAREVMDFDQAVAEAMKFVDHDRETLLIITADHETGGLTLTDGNLSTGFVQGNFSTNDHTAVMVPVFSYGPGADLFKGVYQNTALQQKILQLLTGAKTSR